MSIIKKCKVENCENSSFWKDNGVGGYCNKHYQQIRKFGKILKHTRFDKNEIIDCGNYYEICLYSGLSEQLEIERAIIDKEDLEKVKKYKWHIHSFKNGLNYVVTNINGKNIFIHHLIIDKALAGYVIDHKNTNGLDNRKQNLRLATKSQNGMNRIVNGYSWSKKNKNWRARIMINGKDIYLGNFINKQDAILARKNAEQKYFGEFAFNSNLIIN